HFERTRGIGVLIDKRKLRLFAEGVTRRMEADDRLVPHRTEAEAQQDAALHPRVDAPAEGGGGVGFGGAEFAGFECVAQLVEGGEGFGVADGSGTEREERLN